MGDRWVANFVLRMRGVCAYPIINDISIMKFFVTKFFVETGKNAVHCKKCLKMEEICSALQISEKSFVYLQRNAFFIG